MKTKKTKKDKQAEANEPFIAYGSKNNSSDIRIFNSFEEMNEAEAAEMTRFTPEEHLEHATALIQRIYSEELKKKFSDFTIRFK